MTSLLAYTQTYCECRGGCDAFCQSPNASFVVTPYGQSRGPSDHSPAWSPDASRIAFASGPAILVMDVASGALLNLTNTASLGYALAWSPDGRRIAFISDRDSPAALYLMSSEGFGVVRINTVVSFQLVPVDLVPGQHRHWIRL